MALLFFGRAPARRHSPGARGRRRLMYSARGRAFRYYARPLGGGHTAAPPHAGLRSGLEQY